MKIRLVRNFPCFIEPEAVQWRTQDFFSEGGSTNSVEDSGENGDLGEVAP